MKIKLLLVALIPLLLMGCDMNDLYDEGDIYKTYDGPTVLEFNPLEQEVGVADEQAAVKVQLIGPQQASDLSVSYSVNSGDSSAEEGTHYTISTPSPVTLESGTSTVDIVIELIEDSAEEGEEVTLILNLEGAGDIEASPELATATIFIQG